MGYQQYPNLLNKPGHRVLAALIQSGFPSVPPAFQEVIESGHVRESMQTGACPRWTSDSRTTFTCPFRDRPGLSVFIGVAL
jgi:hypothetical protein